MPPVCVPPTHDHAEGVYPAGPVFGERIGAGVHRRRRHRRTARCATDRRRPGRAQRPRGRGRGPAVVVRHRLDQGQLRGQVVVGDRARRRLTQRDRDRRTGLRPADTRPSRGRVAGRAGFRERVRFREERRRSVTEPEPVGPEIPAVGLCAVNVQSVASAAPPLSLVTCLTSVSCAGTSSFTMEQITVCPSATVTDVEVLVVAPTHAQLDAE